MDEWNNHNEYIRVSEARLAKELNLQALDQTKRFKPDYEFEDISIPCRRRYTGSNLQDTGQYLGRILTKGIYRAVVLWEGAHVPSIINIGSLEISRDGISWEPLS